MPKMLFRSSNLIGKIDYSYLEAASLIMKAFLGDVKDTLDDVVVIDADDKFSSEGPAPRERSFNQSMKY